MNMKLTDNDYIANGLVRELSDAYDGIINYDMVRAVEEAVYVSDPKVFDRSLGKAEVTNITDDGVDFTIKSWDFHVSRNGIIHEVRDEQLIAKAQLLPEFTEALNLGLNLVQMSIESELHSQNIIDQMIDEAKAEIGGQEISSDNIGRSLDALPDDIII